MLFLGIISWKGVSCFIGGGDCFSDGGGFIFKWGCGGCPMGGITFGRGVEKIRKIEGRPRPPCLLPTMGNPEKNHLIIKNNCSILKEQ